MLRSGQAVSAEGPWQAEEPSSPDAAQMRRAKRHGQGSVVSRSHASNGSAWVQPGGVGHDSARGYPSLGTDPGRMGNADSARGFAVGNDTARGCQARGCVEAWPEGSGPGAAADGLDQLELDSLSRQHGYQSEPPDSPDSPQAQKILNAKRRVQAQSSTGPSSARFVLPEAVGSMEGLTQGELDSLAQGSSPTNDRQYFDESFASRSSPEPEPCSRVRTDGPAAGLTQDELDALARQFSPTGVQPDSPDSPLSQQILNSKRQVQARSPPYQEGASRSLSSQASQSQVREIYGSAPSYHGAHPPEMSRSVAGAQRELQEEPWSSQDGLTQRELDFLAQASSPIHAERTWSDSRPQPGT